MKQIFLLCSTLYFMHCSYFYCVLFLDRKKQSIIAKKQKYQQMNKIIILNCFLISIYIKFIMLRVQQKLLQYGIANPKIRHTRKQRQKDDKKFHYPVLGFHQIKLGAFRLNKGHYRNILSSQCLEQLHRFLSSYHNDHEIQNIWIQNNAGVFCGGVDYQRLIHQKEYLDKLCQFAIFFSRINKPIFAQVNGDVNNVGAYFLSMMPMGLGTQISSMTLDETQRGFIPIFGGSHRLAQLPLNIGMFLALTGETISGDQMSRLGLLKGMCLQRVHNKQIRTQMSKGNIIFNSVLPYNLQDQEEKRPTLMHLVDQKKMYFDTYSIFNQYTIFKDKKNIYTRLAQNFYNRELVYYANQKNPFNSFTDKGYNIFNYFSYRLNRPWGILKQKKLVQQSKYDNTYLKHNPVDKICKYFSADSVEKIIQNLQNAKCSWSKSILKKLESKDPLALKLTFQLIKRAEDSNWLRCLQTQYKIARKLLAQSEIYLKEFPDSSYYVYRNKYSNTPFNQLSNLNNVVNKMFQDSPTQNQKLHHNNPHNPLYPTSDYIHIADSPRTYLNRVFFDDKQFRHHEQQVQRYLEEKKINYRSQLFDVDVLRQKIQKDERLTKCITRQQKRIQVFVNDKTLIDQFVNNKIQFLKKKVKQSNSTQIEIGKAFIKAFREKFDNRFKKLRESSKIIGKQRRLEIFRNVRNTLVKSSIMNGEQYQKKDSQRYPFFKGVIQFNQQGKGIYDFQNKFFAHDKCFGDIKNQVDSHHELQHIQLDKTKPQYEDYQNSHLGIVEQISPRQAYLKERQQMLSRRYQFDLLLHQKKHDLKALIQFGGQRSEQIAELLGWDDEDIENLIVSEDGRKTNSEFSAQVIQNMNVTREMKRQALQTVCSQLKYIKQNSTTFEPINEFERLQDGYPLLYCKQFLPQPFKSKYVPMLNEILSYLTEKYREETQQKFHNYNELGVIDQWFNASISMDYTQFIKADAEYLFTYLVILDIRNMLHTIKSKNIFEQKQIDLQEFFKQDFDLNFEIGNLEHINSQITSFLYMMVDTHLRCKDSILLPQSKLLDFYNRLKTKFETNGIKRGFVSFESLMLLVGQQRKKLFNRMMDIRTTLGQQPDYDLSIMNEDVTESFFKDPTQNRRIMAYLKPIVRRYIQFNQQPEKKRQLLRSWPKYMHDYEKVVQQVAGKYNFIPEYLRNNPKIEDYQLIKSCINVKQTNQQWYQRKMQEIIDGLLEYRLSIEKTCSKGQLIVFDKALNELINPEFIQLGITMLLYDEVNHLKIEFRQSPKFDKQVKQQQSSQQIYVHLMTKVKNYDALMKLNNYLLTQLINRQQMNRIQNKNDNAVNEQFYVQEGFQYERNAFEEVFKHKQKHKLTDNDPFPLPSASIQRMIREVFRRPQFFDKEQAKKKIRFKQIENSKNVFAEELEVWSRHNSFNDILQKLQGLTQKIT